MYHFVGRNITGINISGVIIGHFIISYCWGNVKLPKNWEENKRGITNNKTSTYENLIIP